MVCRYRSVTGFLVAQALSFTGTRLSMLALPWFVLETTGSAAKTGLVTLFELTPYLVCKALSGPVVDRVGARRIGIVAELAGAPVLVAIPLLHGLGLLPFWAVLLLVAFVGAARGPSEAAKSALLPAVATADGLALSRVSGLYGTVDRLSQTVGPLLAGSIIAWLGPLPALLLNAGLFVAAAVTVWLTAPRSHFDDAAEDGYLRQFLSGLRFMRNDRLLRAIIMMIAITNMIDVATLAVLLPVWARDNGGPVSIGILEAGAGAAAILGSLMVVGFADRLPKRLTYFLAFMVCGPPRIAVLALDLPLWAVASVWALSGLGAGFINPILSTTMYERIPAPLLGRVTALTGTLAFAATPVGGPVVGWLISFSGFRPAALVSASGYLLATVLPALRPEWKGLQRPDRAEAPELHAQAAPAQDGGGTLRQ